MFKQNYSVGLVRSRRSFIFVGVSCMCNKKCCDIHSCRSVFIEDYVCDLFHKNLADFVALTLYVDAGGHVVGVDAHTLNVEIFNGCVEIGVDVVDA